MVSRMNTIMLLAACCLLSYVQGFKEQAPAKWSPEYLGRYASYPSYASSAAQPTRYKMDKYAPGYSGFVSSTHPGYGRYKMSEEYSGSARSYRPSWFIGSMGTMYKRGPRYLRASDEACVPEGEICIYRGGLVGAVMKLSCCENTSCQFLGRSFVCVADSEETEEEEYYDKEMIPSKLDEMPGYF